MALALWAGWRRLQEGRRRAPPPLTISTLVPVPMATLDYRLAHHRPIQSVYRHCPKAPPECINRPANAFWHLCIFPPQAGLCSACFAKLYVAAIKPPVGELTYLVELSGGLPTTTLRQGEKTTTSGYLARQSCAYDRT